MTDLSAFSNAAPYAINKNPAKPSTQVTWAYVIEMIIL